MTNSVSRPAASLRDCEWRGGGGGVCGVKDKAGGASDELKIQIIATNFLVGLVHLKRGRLHHRPDSFQRGLPAAALASPSLKEERPSRVPVTRSPAGECQPPREPWQPGQLTPMIDDIFPTGAEPR